MSYLYDSITGRVAAIVLQGTPTPPSGFLSSTDEIDNEDLLTQKRDIGSGLLMNRDVLVIAGASAVEVETVGQIAFQKKDGTTLEPKQDAGDDDALSYVLEHDSAFMNKTEGALENGADSVKIAAPSVAVDARLMAFSPDLVLLDTKVSFS